MRLESCEVTTKRRGEKARARLKRRNHSREQDLHSSAGKTGNWRPVRLLLVRLLQGHRQL